MFSSYATSSPAASFPSLGTESSTPLTFKLEHIKALPSSTNYLSLCNLVSIYLHPMVICKYVVGSTLKVTDSTQLATCARNDFMANAAIRIFLAEDFIYLASDATTAKYEYKGIENHRDLRNSSTLHHKVQSLFFNKIQANKVHIVHIASDEHKHPYSTERCLSSHDVMGVLVTYEITAG